MLDLFLLNAHVIAAYMLLFFVASVYLKNNSIVDVGWGLGFVLIAWVSWSLSAQMWFHTLALLLVTIWGFRLAWHIGSRNSGKAEDWRYAAWRKEWGELVYLRSFFQVFVLQGALMLLVALPLMGLMQTSWFFGTTLLYWLGFVVWILGFGCEVLADDQLRQFVKTKNKGQIMSEGLWSISRHPNYFGEAMLWWGIGLMAYAVSTQWWVFGGPLLITLLLRYVSGVPMLEKKYMKNKAFQKYAKKTPIFVPFIRS